MGLFDKLFGTYSERELKRVKPIADKVMALEEEVEKLSDEELAKLAEDMLRNELERIPIRQINDMCQRITPTQGGVYYLIEWDNTKRSHNTVGEVAVSSLHPKQIIRELKELQRRIMQ